MSAILASSLMLLIALVVDGATKAHAISRADAIAAEAARAAATAVDTRGPHPRLDTAAALRAAQTYLSNSNTTGSVEISNGRSIDVTVMLTGDYAVPLPGAGSSFRVTGHATATLGVGVDEVDE